MADVKSLRTADHLTRMGSRLIQQMVDCDTPQESFRLMTAAGFTGSYQDFQADLRQIASAGMQAGLSSEMVSMAAMCCDGHDDMAKGLKGSVR